MTWVKTPDVAQYKGADWNNFIQKVPNCSVNQAKRIAMKNPAITFFFFCREGIILEGPVEEKYGPFNPGDAVFFSGEPWYGSAPQCDGYKKDRMTIAYINNCTPANFLTGGDYTMADGSSSIDVVCIFAANLNITMPSGYIQLAKNMTIPQGYPIACASPTIANETLPIIKQLQDKGIIVLLTILGNHDAAGWSNFSDEATATNFAQQLQEVVNTYGLDGIDIDDEYSNPDDQIPNSLVMVTSIMQQLMPGSIISKALFADLQYFSTTYNGKTLANTLTYGWEMSYGGNPEYRLPPYVNVGMQSLNVSCGFWSGQNYYPADQAVQWVMTNNYGGSMIYAFEEAANVTLMGQIVTDMYGSGNWNKTS